MTQSIQDQVYAIVAKYIEIAPEDFHVDTPLVEAGIDSLATAEIIFDIEEALGIEIPDVEDIEERFASFRTVADVARMVENAGKPAEVAG